MYFKRHKPLEMNKKKAGGVMDNKEAAELLKDIKKAISNDMVIDLKAIYKKEEHTHLIKDLYVQALDKAIDLLGYKEV